MAHRFPWRPVLAVSLLALLAACGGGGGGGAPAPSQTAVVLAAPDLPAPTAAVKRLDWQWAAVAGATRYELLLDPDGDGPEPAQVEPVAGGATAVSVAPPAWAWWQRQAEYRVRACDTDGCGSASQARALWPAITGTAGLLKADTPVGFEYLGASVALSADGSVLAVGATRGGGGAGVVSLYDRGPQGWRLLTRLAPDTTNDPATLFGRAVSLSADGRTLAVGAPGNAFGLVYVYHRDGEDWTLARRLQRPPPEKARPVDLFGDTVSLSADGRVLAIGAPLAENGIGVFLSVRTAEGWKDLEPVAVPVLADPDKADRSIVPGFLGSQVALSRDGRRLAVGASMSSLESRDEGSPVRVVATGAVFVYTVDPATGMASAPQALLPPSRETQSKYGNTVALSADGHWLAVGSGEGEWAGAVYLHDLSATNPGAPVATFKGQRANQSLGEFMAFTGDGATLVVGAPGDKRTSTLADPLPREPGLDDPDTEIGAAVVYTLRDGAWHEAAVLKPAVATRQRFGAAVAISADGRVMAVGSPEENGSQGGIRPALPAPLPATGAGTVDDEATKSGAVYLF